MDEAKAIPIVGRGGGITGGEALGILPRRDHYTPPEPAPYYGWCGACKGWYVRGAPTRGHFTGDRQAAREHVSCGPPVERAILPPAGRRYRPRHSRQPAPALEPGG